MTQNASELALNLQRHVMYMRVDACTYQTATEGVLALAQTGSGSYICLANVHMAMEVYDDPKFEQVVNAAALVTPDGMPLVWALRLMGIKSATRVYGPTLTLHICQAAALKEIPIGLYGGTPESLESFAEFLKGRYPNIKIVSQISPPFRPLSLEEDEHYTEQLVASGARILFVGIGCPRQEIWMAKHQTRIPSVMLGVGAAFDFHSGRVKQAPAWMQQSGLEWLFRFSREPKRLWKRYLVHNPRFVALFLGQWLASLIGWQWFSSRNSSSPQMGNRTEESASP